MEWGKGRPKERRRKVCEWEGSVCVREAIGASSWFMLPRVNGDNFLKILEKNVLFLQYFYTGNYRMI